MEIRTTRNTVAAAVVFSVLSGVSAIGHSNISEMSLDSIRVSYADLNLNQPEDAKTLYARLQNAAENVCDEGQKQPLSDARRARQCREAAMDQAVGEVGNANLTALHQN